MAGRNYGGWSFEVNKGCLNHLGDLMKTYYITFSGKMNDHLNIESWVIRNTHNDLDSSKGLLAEIRDIEKERGYSIRIEFWKLLDVDHPTTSDETGVSRCSCWYEGCTCEFRSETGACNC